MNYWHLYATTGGHYLFGPSAADPDAAATFTWILGMPYVTSWDHQPSQDEVDEALA